MTRYLVHGVLHLAGFDHEADAGEMAEREAELRRELGLETSLIARVSGSAAKDKNEQKRNAGVPPLSAARFGRDDGFKGLAGKRKGGRA